MNSQLQQLFAKFDALNERERLAVLLLLVVAIIIIFVELLISPLNEKYDVIDKQIINLQTQTKQLESQVAILKSKKTRDPDFQEKQKIKLLDEQIS
ncbi:MAG: type II secretion system protein GspM, partial [Gammaproteobacteria bacterium]|nr:type II secretion system protein GspM [Gammaproteobacteria bacterium]